MAKAEKIKTNLIYNAGYHMLIIMLPLVTAPYVTRVLGSDSLGIYTYTQAFANYFYIFIMLGVNNYGNRTIAAVRDNKEMLYSTFWEIFSFQFVLGIVVSAIYLIYSVHYAAQDNLIFALQAFYVVSGMFDVNWLCFGLEKFKLTTIRSTIIRLTIAVSIFLFIKDASDLTIYTFILSFGNLLGVIAIWPFVFKNIDFRRPTIKGVIKHIKPNLILFWPVIAVSLYNIMDKLMLGNMSTKAEVCFYTYAESITQIPNTLILALDSVIMPRMANLFAKKDEAATAFLMDNVMLFATAAAVAMAFGLAGIAPIFAPWFYGDAFTRCGLFIVMLCPIIVFKGWAGALRTQYIIPRKKDHIYLLSLTSGAAVNVLLNLMLIPHLKGIGAVIGTIAAELTVALIQSFMLRNEIKIGLYLRNGLVFCLIGSMMFALVRLIALLHFGALATMICQITIGAAFYITLGIFYLVVISNQPYLVNELLKTLKIPYQFKDRS